MWSHVVPWVVVATVVRHLLRRHHEELTPVCCGPDGHVSKLNLGAGSTHRQLGKYVIPGQGAKVGEAHASQQGDDVLPGSLHDLPSKLCLHGEAADVDLLPGNGAEHCVLGALDVQAEEVDGRVSQGLQQAVERQALHNGNFCDKTKV